MGRYAICRILLLIPTLLAVYTISFLLIHATPGGPWDEADKPLTAEQLKALNEKFGIDKPLWRQYSTYLWNVLHGDFGPSFAQRGRTVGDIFHDFLPVSIQLGIVAIILAAVMGITAGTFSAIRQNSVVDYLFTTNAIIGISAPSYVIASLLILLFANQLHLVPTGGWNGIFSKTA